MSNPPKSYGEVGFNAYGERPGAHGPWKTFDGRDMPKWEGLQGDTGALTKERWEVAAEAIIAEYLRRVGSPVGPPPQPVQKPTVSRDVHFTDSAHGGPLAAKVTAVHENGTVDLVVFPPVKVAVMTGGPFNVAYASMGGPDGTTPTPGCWNWPPRT